MVEENNEYVKPENLPTNGVRTLSPTVQPEFDEDGEYVSRSVAEKDTVRVESAPIKKIRFNG